MASVKQRRESLHKFLRETTEWDSALKAVMDSIHHSIPLIPDTVSRTCRVLHHHSPSIRPVVNLLQYYSEFIDRGRRLRLLDSSSEMRTNADVYTLNSITNAEFLRPYHDFYTLCLSRRKGWEYALSILPSGNQKFFENRSQPNAEGRTGDFTFWTDRSLSILTDLFRTSSKWEIGCSLFHRIKSNRNSCSSELLTSVLHALAIGRQWQKALNMFEKYASNGMKIDAVAYDRLIHACYRALQYKRSTVIMQEILRIGMTPHESSVRMCLHAAEESGNWKISLYLLRGLQESNINVTPLMYEEAIRSVLCNRYFATHYTDNAWSIALLLIQEMRKRYNVPSNSYLNELLLAAWIRCRKTTPERAYHIFIESQRGHIVKNNSRLLMDAVVEKSFYEKRWRMLFLMKKHLNKFFARKNTLEANLIVAATAFVGHWWGAIAIWLRHKEQCSEPLCPEVQKLLTSCADKIENRSIANAIKHELSDENREHVLQHVTFSKSHLKDTKHAEEMIKHVQHTLK